MPLLVVDAVAKAFGDKRVLTAGSLRATEGELRVLFGRNGSGKSTLLRSAAGWLAPDAGLVVFDGVRYARPRLRTLVDAGLCFLPDQDLLSSAYTLERQLGFFAARFGGTPIGEALELVGLAGRERSKPHELSGGERRRAELAAILVRQPRCLLADEPFRGVPPKEVPPLVDALRHLRAAGCAIVVTGHDVPVLMEIADQVTWCTGGSTVELGTAEETRGREGFRRGYLGSP